MTSMTPEDTFNRLRRPSLKEIIDLVNKTCQERSLYVLSTDEVDQLLEPHYWTYKEYHQAFQTQVDRYYKKLDIKRQ